MLFCADLLQTKEGGTYSQLKGCAWKGARRGLSIDACLARSLLPLSPFVEKITFEIRPQGGVLSYVLYDNPFSTALPFRVPKYLKKLELTRLTYLELELICPQNGTAIRKGVRYGRSYPASSYPIALLLLLVSVFVRTFL